jgi:hypothetical protein
MLRDMGFLKYMFLLGIIVSFLYYFIPIIKFLITKTHLITELVDKGFNIQNIMTCDKEDELLLKNFKRNLINSALIFIFFQILQGFGVFDSILPEILWGN